MRLHLTGPRAPWAKADRSSNASLQVNRGRQVDTAAGRLDACEKADARDLPPGTIHAEKVVPFHLLLPSSWLGPWFQLLRLCTGPAAARLRAVRPMVVVLVAPVAEDPLYLVQVSEPMLVIVAVSRFPLLPMVNRRSLLLPEKMPLAREKRT